MIEPWMITLSVSLVLLLAAIWLWLSDRKAAKPLKLKPIGEQPGIIFDDDFGRQLREQGRQQFEKIINENAMFMQQDLHLTASQLNDYMRQTIKAALDREFKLYIKSIDDARQAAVKAIQDTQQAIVSQPATLPDAKVDAQLMTVVGRYLKVILTEEIDDATQRQRILKQLKQQAPAIIEDIRDAKK